jgi:hypothetical protein
MPQPYSIARSKVLVESIVYKNRGVPHFKYLN